MRDDLPTGHRAFRMAILAGLVAVAFTAGAGDAAVGAAGSVLRQGGRLTRAVWEPLFDGGGWVEPLLPGRSPSPGGSPSAPPSAVPQPAAPAPGATRKR